MPRRWHYAPDLPWRTGGMVATVLVDETDQICQAIRDNVQRGANHITLFTSGGLGPRETATRSFWAGEQIAAAVAEAHALGVPIVAHCHGGPSAPPLIEAVQAARLGMSNGAVVQALTGRAAQALGEADELGSLRPGLAADLIAVDADSLADVSALERVALVMARGTVVKWPSPKAGVA
jgi:imidazolonepropionase-like amidohydrolase